MLTLMFIFVIYKITLVFQGEWIREEQVWIDISERRFLLTVIPSYARYQEESEY